MVITIEKSTNDKLMDKVDDILIDHIKKKVYKNESEDDITDSIKNLLNSDLDKPDKKQIKENKVAYLNTNKEIDKLKNMHFLQVENNTKNSNVVPANNPSAIINSKNVQQVLNVNMPVPNQFQAVSFNNNINIPPQQINYNMQNQFLPQLADYHQYTNQMQNQIPDSYTNNNMNQNNVNNLNNMNMFQVDNMMGGKLNQNNFLQTNKNNYNNIDYNNILNQNNNNNSNSNENNSPNNNQSHPKNEELDIIFEHVFINQDGQKYIPNTNNQIYFDQNLGDFVLPEEIIKEDNVTKMLRIKAILDSMDFDIEETAKKIKITDPPIIKGIEKIIPQMNKRENTSSEKIDTKIIKHDFENTYFLQKNEISKKIRQPPIFMN